MYIVYTVQCMYNLCTVYVQCMNNVCTGYAQCMYNICTVYVQYMYSVCTMYVQCMYRDKVKKVKLILIAVFLLTRNTSREFGI